MKGLSTVPLIGAYTRTRRPWVFCSFNSLSLLTFGLEAGAVDEQTRAKRKVLQKFCASQWGRATPGADLGDQGRKQVPPLKYSLTGVCPAFGNLSKGDRVNTECSWRQLPLRLRSLSLNRGCSILNSGLRSQASIWNGKFHSRAQAGLGSSP